MDRSSTSNLIRQMKNLGLVDSTPDPADSRGVIVALTALGNRRVAEALDLRGSEFFERTGSWEARDLATLVDLLHRFNATDLGAGR
ncbi:MAG: hypothetical protein QOH69_1750 [Actinomycetota bacterium]|nr:hypothetical protein [Actinomycetota bacterium]